MERIAAVEAVGAVLIDIDGVLTVDWKPLPGAVAAMERLRAAGLPLALVTNTTSRTRASIAAKLAGAGFPISGDDVLTAPSVTAAHAGAPPRRPLPAAQQRGRTGGSRGRDARRGRRGCAA